jgi:hypothetical protein
MVTVSGEDNRYNNGGETSVVEATGSTEAGSRKQVFRCH